MGLGPADHDAVGPLLDHVQEHVGVFLFVGGQAAVALGVGHGAVDGPVLSLGLDDELLEVLVVLGAVLLVDLIGGGIDGVDGVHADTSLEAGGGDLAQQALHLHLFHQVVGGLVDVHEAVDGFAGQVGGGGHQVRVVGALGQVIGHLHGVHGGSQNGVVHGVLDLLTKHINLHIQLAQAFHIFFSSHQCHNRSSFLSVCWVWFRTVEDFLCNT